MAFERVAQVGERLRVAAQLLALRVAARGVEWHGDVVAAADSKITSRNTSNVRRISSWLWISEKRDRMGNTGPRSASIMLWRVATKRFIGRPIGDEQQAQVDEHGDAERDVIALR